MKKLVAVLLIVPIVLFCISAFKISEIPVKTSIADTLHYPEEVHLKNIRQLTFGGDNAEAYFSFDGKWLVFQKTNPKENIACDQIFVAKIPTSPNEKFEPKLVSSGKGRTTCGAFTKDGKHVIYA